jgi:hypothetical protein
MKQGNNVVAFSCSGHVQQGRRIFVRAGGAVPIETLRAVLLLPTCQPRNKILSAVRTPLPRTPGGLAEEMEGLASCGAHGLGLPADR